LSFCKAVELVIFCQGGFKHFDPRKNTERHRKVPAETTDRGRKTQKNTDSQRYGLGLITYCNLRMTILRTSSERYKSNMVYK
jgi:hypothetical protein